MRKSTASKPKYRRVMLKLSGEALLGPREHGISPETCAAIAKEIKDIKELGIELAIVIGRKIRNVSPTQAASIQWSFA